MFRASAYAVKTVLAYRPMLWRHVWRVSVWHKHMFGVSAYDMKTGWGQNSVTHVYTHAYMVYASCCTYGRVDMFGVQAHSIKTCLAIDP